MLFNIEFDNGSALEGYLVPDGFSEVASIQVTLEDGQTLYIPCDQHRPSVQQAGRHATGLVGFRLDEATVPNISSQKILTIKDSQTGILVYRRPIESFRVNKILRMHFSLMPFLKFDQFCSRYFQYAASSVERFGHETTLQIFHLHGVNSIYLSGRLLLRNYEGFLDKGFIAIAELPEPYYELATRLLIIKGLAARHISFVNERDRILLAPAVEHFSDVNLEDEKQLKRAFRSANEKVRGLFRSPVTRQLTCGTPEQPIDRRSVAAAVDSLSRFKIAGYGANNTHFSTAVAKLLDCEPEMLPSQPRQSVLQEIAERLRMISTTEALLEEDLIVDHYIRDAMEPYMNVDHRVEFI